LGGLSAEGHTTPDVVAGGLSLGGVSAEREIEADVVAGGLSVGGLSVEREIVADVVAGGLSLGGLSVEREIEADLVLGGMSLGGRAIDTWRAADVVAGGRSLGGRVIDTWRAADVVRGGRSLGGLSAEAEIEADVVVGGVSLGGLSAETEIEADVVVGGVSLGGQAIEAGIVPPIAINTSFTYTSGGALEAHLWDGSDATAAADPSALTVNTQAAYDFGNPFVAVALRLITATANGFGNAAVFNVQYSDISLTSGFLNVTTVSIPAGLGKAVYKAIPASGAHRYWRIAYASGTTAGGAWLGELSFYGTPANLVPPRLSPVAVNTSFTYTTGALESHLYDGVDGTSAADPAALNANTHAAYDFGAPVTIQGVRAITAVANGFGNPATFNIQYSDTSLTAGFSTAVQIAIPAGLGKSVYQLVPASGAHRYWRIFYLSGTLAGGAWLGELSFYGS
jgi:hypothetical protein